MIGRSSILSILAGGAVMAPLFVFGHACEFLVARLDIRAETIHLEITADLGGNPLIADENEAREAVKSILQIHAGEKMRSLEELAPLKIEHRSEWDAEAPTAFSPSPDGQPHQLLTAVWQWKPDADELTLAVPEGNDHDVLLWTRDEKLPGRQAKWMMLIEGESTPVIKLERPPQKPWGTVVLSLVSLVALLAWRVRRRGSSQS